MNITYEMIDWFEKRTNRHIDLVWKYLYKYFYSSLLPDEIDEMLKEDHDASKFKEPELTPYILITWNYHCKDVGIPFSLTPEIKKMMNEATEHHVRSNRHHPEYWSDWSERTDSLIPKDDRDKFDPSKVPTIHISDMPRDAMIEMCADWCAMSEERNNTPFEWYDKVVGTRWDFGRKDNDYIYDILKRMW